MHIIYFPYSQIEKLRSELSQVEDERDDLVETLQNLKKIMEK